MLPRATTECALVVGLKFPLSTSPPPSRLPPHWQSSHIWNNPLAIIAINKKNLFIWSEQQSQWIHATMGSEGKNGKEWNLDIHTKEWNQFEPNTYLPFLSLCLASLMLWVKIMVPALLSVQAAPCLVDNYRLAWHWHYQYLGKLFPNYAGRDRNLVLHLLCREDRNVLSVISEASDSLRGLLSRGVNLKGLCLAMASPLAQTPWSY